MARHRVLSALAVNAVNDYIACMRYEEASVTTLTIRNVDIAVKQQLRVRAARRGRSMEAELRAILHDALSGEGEPNLAERIRRRMAPLGGVDLEPHPPVPTGPPPTFDP